MSIRLSDKHGVNPSLGLCFWCGESNGTVLMLGRMKGDKEAPRNMVVDYEPCKSCAEKWSLGVRLIEVSAVPQAEHQQEIQQGLYPTGRWTVMKDEAIERIFAEQAQPALDARIALIDRATWNVLGIS